MDQIKEKKCTHCGKVKPITEFYRHSTSKDGHQCWCKDCSRASQAASPKKAGVAKVPEAFQNVTDGALLAELRRRGYSGDLTKTKIIKL